MTLYELLGRIKDGNAPQKITMFDEDFTFNKEVNDYIDSEGDRLFEDYYWMDELDSKLQNYIDYVITNANISTLGEKKINHVDEIFDVTDFANDYPEVAKLLRALSNKVRELIDEVNK